MSASPVERARQQRALLEDAREQLEYAATARSSAERAFAEAEATHARAVAASRSDRTSATAADAVSRAAVAVEHARADLTETVERHSEAIERVARSERNSAEADRLQELAEVEADLSSPAMADAFVDLGARAARAAIMLRDVVAEIQAALDRDSALVAKARAMGSTIAPRDGTTAAAGLIDAILSSGGSLPEASHAEVRWAIEMTDLPDRAAAILSLVNMALRSTRTDGHDRDALKRMADVWRTVRNASEAHRVEDARVAAERVRMRRDGILSAEAALSRRDALKVRVPRAAVPEPPPPTVGAFSPHDEILPDGAFSRDADGHETPATRKAGTTRNGVKHAPSWPLEEKVPTVG